MGEFPHRLVIFRMRLRFAQSEGVREQAPAIGLVSKIGETRKGEAFCAPSGRISPFVRASAEPA